MGFEWTYPIFLLIQFVALLTCLIASFFIKKRWKSDRNRLPFKSLICSTVAITVYSAINAAQGFILLLLHVTTSPGLTAARILMAILTSIGNVLIFYVLYRVLDRYLARIWNGSDRLASLRRIHKAVISILWLISLAELILYIFISVRQLTDVDVIYSKVDLSLTGVNVAGSLLYLVSSLEVTFWAVFVVVKSRATNLHSVIGRIFICISSVLWLVFNVFACIGTIMELQAWPKLLMYPILESTGIVKIICTIGTYFGIFGCCLRWHVDHRAPDQPQGVYDYQPLRSQQPNGYDGQVAPVEIQSRELNHELDGSHIAEIDSTPRHEK